MTIVDDLGNPVAGATVSGTFTGTFGESVSGVTGSNGQVALTTTGTARGGVVVSFCVDDVAEANERARDFEISPSGPIFGTKVLQPLGAAAEREREALMAYNIPDLGNLRPPRGISLRGARRALRVRPVDLGFCPADGAAKLEFSLPSGSYATALLEEVFGSVQIDGGGN